MINTNSTTPPDCLRRLFLCRCDPGPAPDLFGRLAASSAATNTDPAHSGPVIFMPFTCNASSGRMRRFLFLWYPNTIAALYRRGGPLAACGQRVGLAVYRREGGTEKRGMIRPDPWKPLKSGQKLASFLDVRNAKKIRPDLKSRKSRSSKL